MKNFKKLLSYGLALVLSVSLVGCSPRGDDSNVDLNNEKAVNKLEQIKENGKLVVATSAEYSPYEFHKMIDGKDTIVGFDVMITEAIAKEIGVKVEQHRHGF